MPEKNKLIEVIENAILRAFEDVHTCMPGRIESYSFKTQKATVKPLLKKVYLDGDVLDLPVLGNVPVIFPRTKTSGITFPINKGDKCLLIFSERSLEQWYLSGDNIEPGDRRRYDLSDAIAIPGLFSFAEKNIQTNNNDVEIHHKDQRITLKNNGDIEVGVKSLLKLINENFKAQFDSHVHNFTAAPSGIFSTSTPATTIGVGIPPVGGVVAPFPDSIPASSITSKVTAE